MARLIAIRGPIQRRATQLVRRTGIVQRRQVSRVTILRQRQQGTSQQFAGACLGQGVDHIDARGLGDAFTPEVRSAWAKVYGVLAGTMQTGATEANDTRAA